MTAPIKLSTLEELAKAATGCKRCKGRGYLFVLDTSGDSPGAPSCPECANARHDLDNPETVLRLCTALRRAHATLAIVQDKLPWHWNLVDDAVGLIRQEVSFE